MTSRDVLWEEAVNQHGCVTPTGATTQGLTRSAIDSLLAPGRLQRAASGVYRVPEVPATRYDLSEPMARLVVMGTDIVVHLNLWERTAACRWRPTPQLSAVTSVEVPESSDPEAVLELVEI